MGFRPLHCGINWFCNCGVIEISNYLLVNKASFNKFRDNIELIETKLGTYVDDVP